MYNKRQRRRSPEGHMKRLFIYNSMFVASRQHCIDWLYGRVEDKAWKKEFQNLTMDAQRRTLGWFWISTAVPVGIGQKGYVHLTLSITHPCTLTEDCQGSRSRCLYGCQPRLNIFQHVRDILWDRIHGANRIAVQCKVNTVTNHGSWVAYQIVGQTNGINHHCSRFQKFPE